MPLGMSAILGHSQYMLFNSWCRPMLIPSTKDKETTLYCIEIVQLYISKIYCPAANNMIMRGVHAMMIKLRQDICTPEILIYQLSETLVEGQRRPACPGSSTSESGFFDSLSTD